MAIYHKFGSPVEVVGYCGKHPPDGGTLPLVLVRVWYLDDGSTGYQFARNLRADGGVGEIDAAADAAPEIKLSAAELRRAIDRAS